MSDAQQSLHSVTIIDSNPPITQNLILNIPHHSNTINDSTDNVPPQSDNSSCPTSTSTEYTIRPSSAFYIDPSDPHLNNNHIIETVITEQQAKLLPQFKSRLQEYLCRYSTDSGRNELARNKSPLNTHWRLAYNGSDLPYLYAIRQHIHNPQQPIKVLSNDEFQRAYPPHYGQWPIDLNTLPDRLYIRFMIARKYDIDAAVKQLAQTLAWRAAFGVDELSSLPREPGFPLLMGVCSADFHGYDLCGRPIFINNSGQVIVEHFASNLSDECTVITHVHMMESTLAQMEQQSIKLGKRVDKLVTVQHLGGLTLAHRKLAHIFTNCNIIDSTYYPEFVHQIILINAPSIFPAIWNTIVKPFLDPITAKKISIYGDDTSKWLPALRDTLGNKSIPSYWGGECTHRNNDCLPIVTAQRSRSNETLLVITNYTAQSGDADVKAGKLYTVESEYGAKPDDRIHDRLLQYTVSTSDDIHFTVVYIDALDHSRNKIIRDKQHIRSTDQSVSGEYTVVSGSIGCIQMTFDNTHSLWNTKHIQWSAQITAQTDHGDDFI